MALTERQPPRRRYDNTLRRQRADETRERIVAAGAELLHGFPIWNWRAPPAPAGAVPAGGEQGPRDPHLPPQKGPRAGRRGPGGQVGGGWVLRCPSGRG